MNFMAFFLPSSTSTSTTTSLSSSPLPVLRPLDSEDESRQSQDGNGSLRRRQSDDFPSARNGFTMLGLLSERIEYISGASASDISSLESRSESEVESWTRRATFGDEDDRHTNTRRTSRSTRDARSPSGRGQRGQSPDHHDPVAELSVGTSRSHGARTSTTDHHTGPSSTSEPNVVSSTNRIEGEETVKRRRNRRHGSTEVDRRRRTRRVKLRNRRDSHFYEGFICKYLRPKKKILLFDHGRFILYYLFIFIFYFLLFRQSISLKTFFLRPFHAARDFFLVVTLCFGLACAWMVLARPIMMNWFGFIGSRSGDDEYMYMDG